MNKYQPKPSTVGDMPVLRELTLIQCTLAIATLWTMLATPAIQEWQLAPAAKLFYAFNCYSVALYILTFRQRTWFGVTMVFWMDAFWLAAMLFARKSYPYASLTFLLGIGASVAVGLKVLQWAQAERDQRRKLTLLMNVSRLSNPRFGVDHTINNIMQLTAQFYRASSCVLVMRETEQGEWSMRTTAAVQVPSGNKAQVIDDTVAAPMMGFGTDQVIVFSRGRSRPRLVQQFLARARQRPWVAADATKVGDLLNANAFISAAVPPRCGAGRLYVVAQAPLDKKDAEFLAEVVNMAFPVIENTRLLDRLASTAARREREKIAHDLHDSFLQPYIGLQHALCAMSRKVDADNPLMPDICALSEMTRDVIADLRQLAGTSGCHSVFDESAFIAAVRCHIERLKRCYGLDMAVHMDDDLGINDRMASEVFQIVCEATSNIKKHTAATRGSVTLSCVEGWLKLSIDNEGVGTPGSDFMPRSIFERAAALGGCTVVERLRSGSTAVRVDIPV